MDAEPITNPQIGAHVRIHGDGAEGEFHGNDGMRAVGQGVRQGNVFLGRRLQEA
jgi:hypothetical protein